MKSFRFKKTDVLGKVTLGSWVTMAHPIVAEVLVQSGFDWLTIDLEHSPTDIESAAQLIRIIDLAGISPFVRVGSHDPYMIKRVMDAGAHGIIVSTVNTSEQATAIVAATKYPPKGSRGVGLSRVQGYGADFDAYYKWLNAESLVMVQIETVEAVRNLESILNVPGVDGFFVGPYDLSASLGVPGQFEHPKMLTALKHIDDVRKNMPSLPGAHVVQPDPKLVKDKIAAGYKFIAYGLDFLFLGNKAREGLAAIRNNTQ